MTTRGNDGWRHGPDTATALFIVVLVVVLTVLARWVLTSLLTSGIEPM